MKLKALLLAGSCAALLSGCSAPNEYNTYEVNKKPSSYGMTSLNFWEDDETTDKQPVSKEPATPININAPAGRIYE